MDTRFGKYVMEYESLHYYDSIQAQIDFLIKEYGACSSVKLDENKSNDDFVIIPNLFYDIAFIHSNQEHPYSVRIFSSSGELIDQKSQITRSPFSLDKIVISGMYFVEISSRKGRACYKIIKQ